MRTLAALSLAFVTLFGASSAHAAISANQAATKIKAAIMSAPKSLVSDKGGKFRETLGGVMKGTKNIRSFSASNMRGYTPPVKGTFQPHFVMEIGGIVTGKIDMRNGKVTIKGQSLAK